MSAFVWKGRRAQETALANVALDLGAAILILLLLGLEAI